MYQRTQVLIVAALAIFLLAGVATTSAAGPCPFPDTGSPAHISPFSDQTSPVNICPFPNQAQTGNICPFPNQEQTGNNCPFPNQEQPGNSCPLFDQASQALAGNAGTPAENGSAAGQSPSTGSQDAVTLKPLPVQAGEGQNGTICTGDSCPVPTDPDRDGLYEDLNGDEVIDFVDLQMLFLNLDWIAANEPVNLFDFNRNGSVDFDDITALFRKI